MEQDAGGTKKDLPSRSTRGKRMNTLMKEEAEADEAFWGQDFFKDEAEDKDFEGGEEEEDVVDADFDDPAAEISEPLSDQEEKEKKTTKRKSVYVDPKSKESIKKAKRKAEREEKKKKLAEQQAATPQQAITSTQQQTPSTTTPSTPSSTATAVTPSTPMNGSAKKEKKKKVERKKTPSSERARRKPSQRRRMSQQQMLAEAEITEQYNLASLKVMLQIEEEKKRIAAPKPKIVVPVVRYHSKDGVNTVTFTEVNTFPPEFTSTQAPYPPQPVCEYSGLKAKYVDPLTKKPYATVQAFQAIRKEYQKQLEEAAKMQSESNSTGTSTDSTKSETNSVPSLIVQTNTS